MAYKKVMLRNINIGDEALVKGVWYSVIDFDWGGVSLLNNDTGETFELSLSDVEKVQRWEE